MSSTYFTSMPAWNKLVDERFSTVVLSWNLLRVAEINRFMQEILGQRAKIFPVSASTVDYQLLFRGPFY
jgi:hypothetical protein